MAQLIKEIDVFVLQTEHENMENYFFINNSNKSAAH